MRGREGDVSQGGINRCNHTYGIFLVGADVSTTFDVPVLYWAPYAALVVKGWSRVPNSALENPGSRVGRGIGTSSPRSASPGTLVMGQVYT